MNWTRNATRRTYTCTAGDYQALVWHTSTGEWVALISRSHVAVAHIQRPTLQAAQTWCETHLAKLAANGQPAR